jgi:17beta-estradiol 17-dehydrogenase / very-long-chain 3-oxoacyl-CoA reductase
MVFSVLSSAGIISLCGVVAAAAAAYKVYRFYAFYFRVPANPLKAYRCKDGSWALISGSSGGIGYALAHHLLSLGFGVIIFAHEGVEEAQSRLRSEYPKGNIKAFTLNCATASVSDIQGLVDSIKDLPITVLINNVGSIVMAHPALRPFEEYDADGIDATIALNARFMTHLTRLVLPILKINASPRSLVINISSVGRLGMPYLSIYSATKAYNAAFSASLTREFRIFNTPIDCLAIVPGEVHTDGQRFAAPSPSAKRFASAIVSCVDEAVRRKLVECTPYWLHALQFIALEWLPEDVLTRESVKTTEKIIVGLEKLAKSS